MPNFEQGTLRNSDRTLHAKCPPRRQEASSEETSARHGARHPFASASPDTRDASPNFRGATRPPLRRRLHFARKAPSETRGGSPGTAAATLHQTRHGAGERRRTRRVLPGSPTPGEALHVSHRRCMQSASRESRGLAKCAESAAAAQPQGRAVRQAGQRDRETSGAARQRDRETAREFLRVRLRLGSPCGGHFVGRAPFAGADFDRIGARGH
jgi:hypothetical protein